MSSASRRRTPQNVGNPVYIDNYNICGKDIAAYYYEYINKGKYISITDPGAIPLPDGKKFTPGKVNIIGTEKFENSPYHSTCKLKDSSNATITENQILKMDLSGRIKVIYDYREYDSKPGKYVRFDRQDLLPFLVCKYHSLMYRLDTDIKRLESGDVIDIPHKLAGVFTIGVIEHILPIMDELVKNGVISRKCLEDIELNFENISLYKYIYNNITDPIYKSEIIDLFNKYIKSKIKYVKTRPMSAPLKTKSSGPLSALVPASPFKSPTTRPATASTTRSSSALPAPRRLASVIRKIEPEPEPPVGRKLFDYDSD
jgi:hypothetical protein